MSDELPPNSNDHYFGIDGSNPLPQRGAPKGGISYQLNHVPSKFDSI